MKDYKALIQDIKADKTLEKKLQDEFNAIANSGEKLSDAEIFLKTFKSFGYDFTQSDLEKLEAEVRELELDLKELEAVSGGEEDNAWCIYDENCFVTFQHRGKEGDPCFYDYSCVALLHVTGW